MALCEKVFAPLFKHNCGLSQPSSISLVTPSPDCWSPVLSQKNHLNRTHLTKWSRPKDPRKLSGTNEKGSDWDLSVYPVRPTIHKWRKHGTVVNLPRSGRPAKITPRAQRRLIQQVTKDPTTTSKELQASLALVKVSVHDSTIRKRLVKNGVHSRVPRWKPLLSKKNIKACLTFARKHLDDPYVFWENTTDKTKVLHLM